MAVGEMSFYIVLIIWLICGGVPYLIARHGPTQILHLHRKKKATAIKTEPASKELALPEEPVKSYESYDHPAPPIPLLAASLCQAPIGYGWEITTTLNKDDNPALRLAMLDLRTSIEVDAIEQDMVIVRKWQWADDDTYAAFYRRANEIEQKECDAQYTQRYESWRSIYMYSPFDEKPRPERGTPCGKLAGKVMMANLITPMADWAVLLTLRYIVEHPDDTKCNYMLIEHAMAG